MDLVSCLKLTFILCTLKIQCSFLSRGISKPSTISVSHYLPLDIRNLIIEINLPLRRFFNPILIFDWLAMNLNGVLVMSGTEFRRAIASMRVVCHSTSLNSNISPRSVSRILADRMSEHCCHCGVTLCTLTRDNCTNVCKNLLTYMSSIRNTDFFQ